MTAPLGNFQNSVYGSDLDAFVYPQMLSWNRAPSTQDIYNPGTRIQNNAVSPPVIYVTTGAGVWYTDSGGALTLTSLTVVGPSTLTGTTNINTSGAGVTSIGTGGTGATNVGNATGNTAVTGSLTASTGLIATAGGVTATAGGVTATAGGVTATLGNITATNGNFVGSTAGTGFLFNANTASGAAPGPVVLNSRAGAVTFTGVSIAAAADLTLTITNSAITGASTQVVVFMAGSTTGSAPSIKSVTPSAGSLAIVVTNGTGATTTTANITFTFLVVN